MNRIHSFAFLGAAFGILAAACGSSHDDSTFDQNPPPSAPSLVGGGDQGNLPGTTAGPGPAVPDCTAAAKLVYVVSREMDLHSYAPDTGTFTRIGALSCPGATGLPASMAVARDATVWVNFQNGHVYKVSTTDASCVDSGYAPNQGGFTTFGMAFAASADGNSESLFVSGLVGTVGGGLSKIDTTTLKLSTVGQYSDTLANKAAELTGTSDGRLFGFFTTSPATLARIDMAAGSTSSDQALTGVTTGNSFAFSFWGGDFWFFTSEGTTPSKVTHLDTTTGNISVAKDNVGDFRITGAGVSTCAPLTYVK
jgi:hypothetical protein